MVAEDWIDRSIVSRLEGKTNNPYLRLLLRAGLNPGRSMANLMRHEVPWFRDTRADLFPDKIGTPFVPEKAQRYVEKPRASGEYPEIAPLEVSVMTSARRLGDNFCFGGGATAAYRIAREWQVVADVGGCKLTGLPTNYSGDSLTYMGGVRWAPVVAGKFLPYAQVLVGGMKVTAEHQDLLKKATLERQMKDGAKLGLSDHQLYADTTDANGISVAMGGGVDWRIKPAVAMRLAGIDYTRSWLNRIYGVNYSQSLQLSSGVVIRWGTW
jgi:hypothetical protein